MAKAMHISIANISELATERVNLIMAIIYVVAIILKRLSLITSFVHAFAIAYGTLCMLCMYVEIICRAICR